MTFTKNIIFFCSFVSVFFVIPAQAATVYVDGVHTSFHVGDVITFGVYVDTQAEEVNAVETSIVFPSDLLLFKDVKTTNTQIGLWVEKPSYDTHQTIHASGITPGGFVASKALLYTLVFEVIKEGQATLTFGDVHILLNDGLGTDAFSGATGIHFSVLPGVATIQEKKVRDTEAPELFTPVIAHDVDLFNNDATLIFETSDKQSGIHHYEVKEGFFGLYHTAVSPYHIKNQSLDRNIYIKAIDIQGNSQVVVIYPQNRAVWYELDSSLVSILILCGILILLSVLWFGKKYTLR